jgi:hypothetical protein
MGESTATVTDQEKRQSFSRLATAIALSMSYGRSNEALVKPMQRVELRSTAERTPWASRFSRRLHGSESNAVEESHH